MNLLARKDRMLFKSLITKSSLIRWKRWEVGTGGFAYRGAVSDLLASSHRES